VIIVLASAADSVAANLVRHWEQHQAALMLPRDLCEPGWTFDPCLPSHGVACLNGERIDVSDVEGVFVRLPRVVEAELPALRPEDRVYAAHEMTSFLMAWLAALPCRVINRPTPACLAGPIREPLEWQVLAARHGLFAEGGRRDVSFTVIGERGLGGPSRSEARDAGRLARAVGARALRIHCTADRGFVDADPWPDVADPAVADVVLGELRGVAA
jgi:hypothetical protein